MSRKEKSTRMPNVAVLCQKKGSFEEVSKLASRDLDVSFHVLIRLIRSMASYCKHFD